MKASELVESRRNEWRKLEGYCVKLEMRRRGKLDSASRIEFAALYRSACADLALADAYQLPHSTVRYLHQLVGRAHNQLYRSGKFDFRRWSVELFRNVPQRLFHDGYLRVAMVLFWGTFFLSIFLASDYSPVPHFAAAVVGQEQLILYEEMYSDKGGMSFGMHGSESIAASHYVLHNTSIGIRCFAMGLLLGIGGLFATVFNAVFLGAVFGHMTTIPQKESFFQFVTAHGPFELTAIVLSAAAGMRLGFSMIKTNGLRRIDSLIVAAKQSLPTMMFAVVLFFLAAMIEGFLSPSELPYEIKAIVAGLSDLVLLVYFVILGYSSSPPQTDLVIEGRAT